MSKLNKSIVFLTWLTVLDYCVVGFILMDLNALNWSEGARVIVVFIWVSSMAFGVIACSSIEDTKD